MHDVCMYLYMHITVKETFEGTPTLKNVVLLKKLKVLSRSILLNFLRYGKLTLEQEFPMFVDRNKNVANKCF